MGRRERIAPILIACVLAIGLGSSSSTALTISKTKPALSSAESAVTQLIKHRRRSHRRRLYLPIAPNYFAYDYPYYYRRGYFPKRIGPGYMYYGHPYLYYKRSAYRR